MFGLLGLSASGLTGSIIVSFVSRDFDLTGTGNTATEEGVTNDFSERTNCGPAEREEYP